MDFFFIAESPTSQVVKSILATQPIFRRPTVRPDRSSEFDNWVEAVRRIVPSF
jgi:hypothetical protein